MKNSTNSRSQKFWRLFFLATFGFVVAITLLPFWPETSLFSILGYVLLFAPRWWVLAIPLFLILGYRSYSRWQRYALLPLFVLCINFLDVQWLPSYSIDETDTLDIKVMSVNVGNSGDKQSLRRLIEENEPYVVFLQEARKASMEQIFDDSWITDCAGSLCIASKFAIQRVDALSRRSLGGWGAFATKYNADIFGEKVQLINVHLDTPRAVLEGLIHMDVDISNADDNSLSRNVQASLVSSWVEDRLPAIIAGDFNMPDNENIYQRYLGKLNNVLDYSDIGLRYTKYTKWHGIRIDHILFSDYFTAKRADVLDDFGGDHRPVLAVLGQPI
ncbi:endonuclease/exonuclease/phosphatase family protein [Motiliproteus sp. MSK22-1]|uniref:endonuclease/exonuclease/phosphatase family protein n=1 Tax=Motiliproteus sp. MSK22-1 TaxID=1897630 RepID=UPI000977F2B5|nr:endonuclease/exonuclease/phosphatase family protein [Motiliproteus sp. MSK22-1]OMH25668.1 hypothetical protein BGP75_24300 [Motiliproteus sp. MSK22-1]